MDLSLSVDNVVAAVAMTPDIRVVCIGVFLGLLTLFMFALVSLRMVEKFPILQHTAFLLIGYVGLILLTEMSVLYFYDMSLHISPFQKFIGIAIIMLLSIVYSRNEGLQKLCAPVFKVMMIPVIIYDKVAGTLIGILLWPFKKMLHLKRGLTLFFQSPPLCVGESALHGFGSVAGVGLEKDSVIPAPGFSRLIRNGLNPRSRIDITVL